MIEQTLTKNCVYKVIVSYIHCGLRQLKSTCGPRATLSRFTIKCEKHYAPNWFNCLIVCPFWAKSGKYCSKKRGKLKQL